MALGNAGSIATGSLAPAVCTSCKSRKQKCDKSLPSCSRCKRLLLKCDYSPPVLPGQPPSGLDRDPKGSLASPNSLETCRQPGLKQDLDILQHENITDLNRMNEIFTKHKGELVDLADVFLSSCQRWVHIVHADMFRERSNAIHFVISQEYFALLISMGMISRPFLNGTAPDALRLTMYATVKKLFWEIVPLAQPTICLVQAGLLLSVYEYGQAPPLPQLGTLNPQDEGLQTWWGIMIHERMISLKSGIYIKPLAVYSPDWTENKLLEEKLQAMLPQINLDSHYPCFYLQARAAIWLDRVLDVVRSPSTSTPEGRIRLQHLDRGLLVFLRLLVELGMGTCCEAIAIGLKWRFNSTDSFVSTKQDKLESSQAIETILKVLADISTDEVAKNKGGSNEWMLAEIFPYTVDTIYQLVLEMRERKRLEYQTMADPMVETRNASPTFENEVKMLRYILEKQTMRWQISQEFIEFLDSGSS